MTSNVENFKLTIGHVITVISTNYDIIETNKDSAIISRSTDIEYYDKHLAIIAISTTCIINNGFDVFFTK